MPKQSLKNILNNPLFLPLVLLFLTLAVNVLVNENFFNMELREVTPGYGPLLLGYIPDILHFGSQLVIVTLGMTLVTAASGGQDISVGAIMAISASFCGLMLNGDNYRSEVFASPLLLAMLVGLLAGAVCGLFNGFLVAVLKIQPMIATLVLFTAGRSLSKLITYGQAVYIMNPVYKWLGFQLPKVPITTTIIVTIVVIILVFLLVKLTSLGLYIQSVGINASASRLVGLNSTAIKIIAFVLCGVLAGIAGLMGSSAVGKVESNELGLGIELNAILSVALGGNMLGGGEFSLTGSIIGAYTVQIITTTLLNMNVRADQLNAYKAVIIAIIIIVNSEVVRTEISNVFFPSSGSVSE